MTRKTSDLAGGASVVLRPASSQVAFWAVAAICAIFVGDALLRGRFSLALRTAAVLAVLVWAAWLGLVRMSIRLDGDGVLVRNLLRTTAIPWGRVRDVYRRAQLHIAVDDGADIADIECWGSPFPPRSGRRSTSARIGPASGVPGRSGAPAPPVPGSEDDALQLLRGAWQGAHRVSGEIRRGWDIPAIAVGAVLLACALAAVLL